MFTMCGIFSCLNKSLNIWELLDFWKRNAVPFLSDTEFYLLNSLGFSIFHCE